MKVVVPTSKPRNPLVAAALMRQAGSHQRSRTGLRQQAKRELLREMQREHPPSR